MAHSLVVVGLRCGYVLCYLYIYRLFCCCLFQNCLAKALYDNHAESPEELEFQKGDVLTVLEQNPNGLQGINRP